MAVTIRQFAKDGSQVDTFTFANLGSLSSIAYLGNDYFLLGGQNNPPALGAELRFVKRRGATAYQIAAIGTTLNGSYTGHAWDTKNYHETRSVNSLPPRHRYRVYCFVNKTARQFLGQTNNVHRVTDICRDNKYTYTLNTQAAILPTLFQIYADNAKNAITRVKTTNPAVGVFPNTLTAITFDRKGFILADNSSNFTYTDKNFTSNLQTVAHGGRSLNAICTDGKHIYGA